MPLLIDEALGFLTPSNTAFVNPIGTPLTNFGTNLSSLVSLLTTKLFLSQPFSVTSGFTTTIEDNMGVIFYALNTSAFVSPTWGAGSGGIYNNAGANTTEGNYIREIMVRQPTPSGTLQNTNLQTIKTDRLTLSNDLFGVTNSGNYPDLVNILSILAYIDSIPSSTKTLISMPMTGLNPKIQDYYTVSTIASTLGSLNTSIAAHTSAISAAITTIEGLAAFVPFSGITKKVGETWVGDGNYTTLLADSTFRTNVTTIRTEIAGVYSDLTSAYNQIYPYGANWTTDWNNTQASLALYNKAAKLVAAATVPSNMELIDQIASQPFKDAYN